MNPYNDPHSPPYSPPLIEQGRSLPPNSNNPLRWVMIFVFITLVGGIIAALAMQFFIQKRIYDQVDKSMEKSFQFQKDINTQIDAQLKMQGINQ